MNFSKLEVKSIYETEPGRIKIQPNSRFINKEFGECGNHVLVDGEKTKVMICIKCRDDPQKHKSMFFMVSGPKNELANTKAHFNNNHVQPLDKLKRGANQSTLNFSVEKKSRFGHFSNDDLTDYRHKVTIAICKSNLALDFMENEGADLLIEAMLGNKNDSCISYRSYGMTHKI